MSKLIRIGSASIPLDSYAIGGTAVLGIRESGKTVLAKGVAEQLLDHGIPPVVFDAIGLWRHLKRPGDGPRGRSYKIVVAGGVEPDLPLTPENAAEIVRAAIRENIPLVIDLYDKKLSKADWRKIVRTCFRTLLYENVGVRHIILEEAAEYAPQKVSDGEVYAEVEKMVRMGGNASLGITLINQRAQEINKAILDLCENMVLMRQRGAHAIDSLEKWMDRMAPDQSRAVAKELPTMKSGDCWVFIGDSDTAIRTRSEMCRSFHPDRRRPEGKHVTRAVADTADFVARLSTDLAKIIDESKANDPAALKRRIDELERQLKTSGSSATEAQLDLARRNGYHDAHQELARAFQLRCKGAAEDIRKALSSIEAVVSKLEFAAKELPASGDRPENPERRVEGRRPAESVMERRAEAAPRPRSGVEPSLPRGEATILSALIQFPQGRTRAQLLVLTGYRERSLSTYLPKLAERGYIDTSRGGPIVATEAGKRALPNVEPLPTGPALRDFWLARLPEGERRILKVLIDRHPHPVSRDELMQETQYAERSISTYIPRLAAKNLVISMRGEVCASGDLFSS